MAFHSISLYLFLRFGEMFLTASPMISISLTMALLFSLLDSNLFLVIFLENSSIAYILSNICSRNTASPLSLIVFSLLVLKSYLLDKGSGHCNLLNLLFYAVFQIM